MDTMQPLALKRNQSVSGRLVQPGRWFSASPAARSGSIYRHRWKEMENCGTNRGREWPSNAAQLGCGNPAADEAIPDLLIIGAVFFWPNAGRSRRVRPGESSLWCLQQESRCFLSTHSLQVGLGSTTPSMISSRPSCLSNSTVALNLQSGLMRADWWRVGQPVASQQEGSGFLLWLTVCSKQTGLCGCRSLILHGQAATHQTCPSGS